MVDDDRSDERWGLLERASPEIVAALSPQGVRAVEFVAGFPQVEGLGVWLVVESDREKEALAMQSDEALDRPASAERGVRDDVEDAVASILGRLADGVRLGKVSVVVQSEETVQRDFEGSWFYATR